MPAVMQIAAKSMNMSAQEFLKAMENGAISAQEFMPVFTKAMQEMAAPGLNKAFKTMNTSFKRMTQQGKLLIKALFDSGVGELFTQIFNSLSDIFEVMQPIFSLLGSFASTVIKTIIFPIRLVIALIRDAVVFTDYWLNKTFGVGLNKILSVVGEVGALLITIFGNVFKFVGKIISPVVSAIKWILSKLSIFKVGKAAVQGSGVMNTAVGARVAQGAQAGANEAGSIARNIANSTAVQRTMKASAGVLSAQEAVNINQRVSLELTGPAKDVFRENRGRSNVQINVDSRG